MHQKILPLFVVMLAPVIARAAPTLPLLYSDDFEHGMERWQTLDPKGVEPCFKVVEVDGPTGKQTSVLRALGTSQYDPPFRSPPNFALLIPVSLHVLSSSGLTMKNRKLNVTA